MEQPIGLRLSEFLPYRLSILSNRVSNVISGAYRARFGLTVSQWRVIAVLAEFGEMTARDIGASTQMDKVSVSRAVAKLTERALIRPKVSRTDGRSRLLSLTKDGKAIFDEVAPMARQFEDDLLSDLSVAEAKSLHSLIDRLSARLEAIEATAD